MNAAALPCSFCFVAEFKYGGGGDTDAVAWLTPEVCCAPHSVQKGCVPSEGEDNPKTVNKTPVH